MKNRLVLAVVTAFAFVACSVLFAQDTKVPARPTKGARGLPPNWGKLGLSDEQKQQVYTIQLEYRTKIDALQQQIREQQKKERSELNKVLTDAQKARLKEIITSKAAGDVGEDKIKGNKDKDK